MKKKIGTPLIIGNWKATPDTQKEAVAFVKTLEKKLSAKKTKKGAIVPHYFIAAPDIFVPSLIPLVQHGSIGVQNISGITGGQETGTTTAHMAASTKAEFAILGHSEVRKRGETSHDISQKLTLSLKAKLLSVVCVGEHVRDKEGNYLLELEHDLKEILLNIDRGLFSHLVIAYEPIWAIGAKNPATPAECFEAVIALRRALAGLVGIEHAKKVSIIYGGAVTKETCTIFLQEGGVDGFLIGRASQDVKSFLEILETVF